MERGVTFSRGSNNEGSIEVAIDDERGQGIVLADLVLRRIDLFRQQFVKVYLLPCVKLLLQAVLEAHDHVQTITVEHLKDEHVGPVRRITHCDRASENTLLLEVS